MLRSRLSIFGFWTTPVILLSIFLSLMGTPSPAYAAGLDVQPLTWNIIGLDSNKPSSGPNHFPVGVRVCNNSGEAVSNVTAILSWDSFNAYIDFRPGTSGTVTRYASPDSLGIGACADFYFEVEVEKNTAAYDTTRRYHVDVTAVDAATGGTNYSGSTPTPRELYVEHLVSQSRNAVTDVQYGIDESNLASVPAGGTMALMVGQTYFIKLVGFTATQGYNQLESFINFPNTIFQVLSVKSVYSAPSTGYTIDKMYSDACGWDNVVSSPTYRSCIVSDDKTGGNIEVTYEVKIIKVPDSATSPVVNPEPLTTLIYDFSGSSYHYNADFGISARYAYVLDATAIDISKSFSPATISPGSSSTLTFTIKNNAPASVAGVSFTDTMPILTMGASTGQMVADPATYLASGCGTASDMNFAAGDTSLSFSGGALAPNGTCTMSVSVTVPDNPSSGNYHNESGTVKVGDLDSGHKAVADLAIDTVATTPGVGLCGQTLAKWIFPAGSSTITPVPTIKLSPTYSASALLGTGLTGILSSSNTVDGTQSWGSNGNFDSIGALNTTFNDYFQFAIDTTGYSKVELSFWARRPNGNSPTQVVVYSGTTATPPGAFQLNIGDGTTTLFPSATNTWEPSGTITFDSGLNPAGLSYFRIYGAYAKNNNPGSDLYIDDVLFTGCSDPIQPVLTKVFSPNPVVVGGTSRLTFTLSNDNTVNLTGAKFIDALPAGLEVAASPNAVTTCNNAAAPLPSWAPVAGSTLLEFGQTTGGTIPAGNGTNPGTCTVAVDVVAATEGPHQNISDFIHTTEGGTNAEPGGSAKANLVAILPPTIDKHFNPSTILAGETSALNFILANPNPSDALTNVAFSDTLPTGMTLASDVTTPQCGGAVSGAAGSGAVGFSGGTIPAGGNCSVMVMVTASGLGEYVNTSNPVTVTIGGLNTGTDTASATLTVNAPNPAISILKRVSTSASGPWYPFLTVAPGTPVFYQFTVENTGDVNLDNVSVSDPTLTSLGLDLSGCSWATLARYTDAMSCVTVATTALSGSNQNTATAHGTYTSGGETKTASSSALYTGVNSGEFSLLKQISTKPTGPWSSSITAVDPGSTIYYKFTIVNATGGPLTSLNITDVDPGVDTTSCVFTNPLPNGSATTCIVSATISTTDVTTHTNTATAHGTDGTSTVIDSPSSSADYTPKAPDLQVTKSNNTSGTGTIGTAFTWTISVENLGTDTATFADGQTVLSDPLPAGATYENFVDPGLPNLNCALTASPDTITCTANGSFSMVPGAQFDVAVDVRPTADGDLSSTATVDPAPPADGNIGESDEGNNISTDTVTVIAAPTITKSFSPDVITVGGTSTLTITITNPNVTAALDGIAFTDNYPFGVTNAIPLVTSNTCSGALVAVGGVSTISLAGGGPLAAGSSCVITVSVVAFNSGTFVNTSGNVRSSNGGTGNTASDTLKVFDALPGKEIVATSEASTGFVGTREKVTIGEMVRYRIWAQLPEGSFTNLQFTDSIPNGLQFLDDGTARFAFVSDEAGINSSTLTCANDTGVAVDKTSLPSTTVDCLLIGAINDTADAGTAFGNGEDVTFSLGNITNADNDSNDNEFVVVEFNALVLNLNSSATINQGVDNDPASATAGQTDPNWRINTARLLVNGAQVGADSSNVNVEIAEAAITVLTKSETSGGSYLPGSDIQYTLVLTNNATGEDATTAFDIRLSDGLDTNLMPGTIHISSTQGTSNVDTCAGGTLFTASSTLSVQNVTVDVSCLDVGESVTVEINATIKAGTAVGTTISNTSNLSYTSLPGALGNCGTAPFTCTVFTTGTPGPEISERTGAGGAGSDDLILNNYATQSGNVDFSVNSSDLLPVAAPDTNTAVENGPAVTGNVLPNEISLGDEPTTVTASDQGSTAITIGTAFTTAAGGTLTLNADGSYSYTPPAWNNVPPAGLTETFNYTITDADGDPSSSTLAITVLNANQPPVANDDSTSTQINTPVTFSATGNDTDNDGTVNTSTLDLDPSTAGQQTTYVVPGEGTFTVDGSGDVTFTPVTNFLGISTILYTIQDNDGLTSNQAELSVTVTNDPPVATDNTGSVDGASTTHSGNMIADDEGYGVDSDPNSDPLAVTQVDGETNPANDVPGVYGSLDWATDGSYIYTLDTGDPDYLLLPGGAAVTETFPYTISDGNGGTDTANIVISVSGMNDVPVANDDSYTVGEDSGTTTLNPPVTADDDFGGEGPSAKAITITTGPMHGTAVVNDNGTPGDPTDDTVDYTPDADYNGSDSFEYEICDVDDDCDQATVNLSVSSVEDPVIGIAKRMTSITRAGSGTFNVTLEFHLQNYGDVSMSNVQVMDDMSATFPAPNTFSVESVAVSGLTNASLTANPGYNGSTDLNLLTASGNSLAINGSGTIIVVVNVLPSSSGPFFNSAAAEAETPTGTTVTDDSSDGTDPDSTSNCPTCINGDGDPNNNTKQTEINFDPNIFDPPFGFKEFDPSGLPVLRWTMIWINDNNFPTTAAVSDPIPTGSTYQATGASSGFPAPVGAPAGSTNLGVSCTTDSAAEPAPGDSESTTSLCYYEGPTATYPRGRIVWEGLLGPDLGATNQSNANDEVYITFAVRVATGVTSVQNAASIDADLNNDTDLTDPGEQVVATAQAAWQEPATPVDGAEGKKLPATGFAPEKITALPQQRPEQTFMALDDMWLEIPSLGVKTPVVGVPKNAGAWNVDWLWEHTGWLQGTAFPTWDGNSLLTAHVYLPNGKPGPFVDLGKLRYGDQLIVHAFGERYIYEVRTNRVILPTDMSPFKHEEKAWLTLLTCKSYEESTDTYKYRVMVRAVLIKVEAE